MSGQMSGLPKVPKVLSVIVNASKSHWEETGKLYAAQLSMKQEVSTPSSRRHSTFSSAMAKLRQEQSALRQVDALVLCRLMGLNNSISEYKASMEHFLSESSDILLEDYDDDDEVDRLSPRNGF